MLLGDQQSRKLPVRQAPSTPRAAPRRPLGAAPARAEPARPTASRGPPRSSCRWSSVNANRTVSPSRQAEHALGDDVALDLVGAGIDRAGQGEQVVVEPAAVLGRGRLLLRSAARAGRAGAARSRAGRCRARTRRSCSGWTRHRAARPRARGRPCRTCTAGTPRRRSRPWPPRRAARSTAPPSRPGHRPTSRSAVGEEPSRAAQGQPSLRAGRRHRDPPALAGLAEHVLVGHEDVVAGRSRRTRSRRPAGGSGGPSRRRRSSGNRK